MTTLEPFLADLIKTLPPEKLEAAWNSIDKKLSYIIQERSSGRTLEDLGDEFGVTRERIRQLQNKGAGNFIDTVASIWDGWDQWANKVCNSLRVIDIRIILERFSASSSAHIFIPQIFDFLGWKPQFNRSHWWLRDEASLDRAIKSLVFDEPVSIKEWEIYRAETELPNEYINYLIEEGILRLQEYRGYMIRTQNCRLDKTHAYFLDYGPSRVEDIARAVGETNCRNFQEFMRRQRKFSKHFGEKKWGLSENVVVKYRTATAALLDLLTTRGAMSKREIHKAMDEIYPVSVSRVQQCLNDFRIGVMPDGKYELIERGARKPPEAEPRQPAHMSCAGSIVGVRKELNTDIMRGSGIIDHKWLAWKLGLHSTPREQVFSGLNGLRELSVSRAGDNCQLSSLRDIVTEKKLVEGCWIVIILDIGRFEWDLKHVCTNCKANLGSQTE